MSLFGTDLNIWDVTFLGFFYYFLGANDDEFPPVPANLADML